MWCWEVKSGGRSWATGKALSPFSLPRYLAASCLPCHGLFSSATLPCLVAMGWNLNELSRNTPLLCTVIGVWQCFSAKGRLLGQQVCSAQFYLQQRLAAASSSVQQTAFHCPCVTDCAGHLLTQSCPAGARRVGADLSEALGSSTDMEHSTRKNTPRLCLLLTEALLSPFQYWFLSFSIWLLPFSSVDSQSGSLAEPAFGEYSVTLQQRKKSDF